MQVFQRKTWERKLQASVSIAVLCLALPHPATAQLALYEPSGPDSAQTTTFIVKTPALPWLAHKTGDMANPYKQKPAPAAVAATAHYASAPHEPKKQAPESAAAPSAQQVTGYLDAPREQKPGHAEPVAHAEVSQPLKVAAKSPLAVTVPPALVAPHVSAAQKPVIAQPAQALVSPVAQAAPTIKHTKSPLEILAELAQQPKATPAQPEAAADKTAPVVKSEKSAAQNISDAEPVKLQPPAANGKQHHLDASVLAEHMKPAADTGSAPEEVKPAQHATLTLKAPSVTTGEAPKLIASAAEEAAPAKPVVLTSPPLKITSRPFETRTVLERIEIASQTTIEPVITGRAFSEQDVMAQLSPAAGEPTVLMPPSTPPSAADSSVAPVTAVPLPKLNLPGNNPIVEPTTAEASPAPASVIVEPNNDVKIVKTATPHVAAEGPGLSRETKEVLDRLPPEPLKLSPTKKRVVVEQGTTVATKEEDVKKHEAYGMKIAVKRPKMDTFRTLESAYNSLIAGDQQYAITQYKEVLSQDPDNTMALFGLATTYHRAGELGLARPLYSKLLEIDPHNLEGLNNFLVLLSDESPREALVELEKLRHTHPSFSPVPAQMALIYEKDGDYSKAAEQMARAIAITPENLKYQYDMAIIYDRMGDWPESAKWYQRLVSADARGEKIPGNAHDIQQRLTFIQNNMGSHHS